MIRTLKGHQRLLAKWKDVPHGAKVVVEMDSGERRATTTRSAPEIAASGHAVVWLHGISGYYLLERVKLACGGCGHAEVHCLASGCNHKADGEYCECTTWVDQRKESING